MKKLFIFFYINVSLLSFSQKINVDSINQIKLKQTKDSIFFYLNGIVTDSDVYRLANFIFTNKRNGLPLLLQTSSQYTQQFNQVNLECIQAAFTGLLNKKCKLRTIDIVDYNPTYNRLELTCKIRYADNIKKITYLKIHIVDFQIETVFLGDCENGCR